MNKDNEQNKLKLHLLVEKLRTSDSELLDYLRQEINRATDSNPLEKIEHYLGLDFELDDVDVTKLGNGKIDYSFISDKRVLIGIESDYREMMRYRYGCRSHKEDFYEYCKYAHFQLEALTNYFMEIWSTPDDSDIADVELAKINILKNWPDEKKPDMDSKEQIDEIPYNTKIRAIIEFLNLNSCIISHPDYIYYNLRDVVDNIRNVRNDLSHRGESQSTDMQNAIDDFESSKTLKTTSTGKSNVYDFTGRWKVKYYLWLRSTPWDDVISVLCKYSTAIKQKLD